MSDLLLTTKLHIPPLWQELVTRPRLIERLSAGLAQSGSEEDWRFARRLTLVCAPAGYDQSTCAIVLATETRGGRGWRSEPTPMQNVFSGTRR
jgi:ATP/maltotriose-dependent transcriptional regulator MalT